MSKRPVSPVHRAAAGITSAVGGALKASQSAGQALVATRLADAVYTSNLEALQQVLASGVDPDLPVPDRSFTPLMVACGRDWIEGAQTLLEKGANVNALATGYGTPLTFALTAETRAAVPLLLDAGADPNAVPKGISAPLIFTLGEKQEATAHLLLDRGANPNAQDGDGWSALAIALAESMDELALELIRRGARPDHVEPSGWTPLAIALDGMLEPQSLAMLAVPDLHLEALRLEDGRGLLDLAASGGLLRAGARLLDLGAPVNGAPDQKVPPLHRALIFGQPTFADLLLARGASLTGTGEAPLLRAAAFVGHLGCLEQGHAQGMNLLTPDILEAAALGGSMPALTWLKEQGADLAAVPAEPTLPVLHAAAFRGRTEVLRWLLAQGVPVGLMDAKGRTALRLALEEDAYLDITFGDHATRDPLSALERLEALTVLLDAGADLTAEAEADEDLVELLLESGRIEVLLPLIERGLPIADPGLAVGTAALRPEPTLLRTFIEKGFPLDVPDAHGETSLHIAAALDHGPHVDLLVEAGHPVDPLALHGVTPLLRACLEGARSAAERLLAHGAKANAQDAQGWTPLMLAAHGGHAALAQLLLKHGAKRSLKNQDGATALTYARKLKRKDLMKLLS